jgi:NADPH-dependent 2,4-dienoyl-CoA reductase/sulfur reductase-like enzyme
LNGKVKLTGKKVAVVGSGMAGIETAHFLAEGGNEVSLFEMADTIGPGLYFQYLIDIMDRIGKLGVKLYSNHKLVEIQNNTTIFETAEDEGKKEYPFDAVVIAVGAAPNSELTEEIQSQFERVYLLGDAVKVGKIRNALESGFITAYNLS